jgi:hypothetical protein
VQKQITLAQQQVAQVGLVGVADRVMRVALLVLVALEILHQHLHRKEITGAQDMVAAHLMVLAVQVAVQVQWAEMPLLLVVLAAQERHLLFLVPL